MAEPRWKQFELLVAEIQKELSPGALVKHNAHLEGRHSNTSRQVDVLVTGDVGQFPVQIAFDCKDHADPVDVKAVEEFAGLVDDIGVHKGVIVAAKGFTAAAKARAEALRIQLYGVVDTRQHAWQANAITMPMLCDFRGVAMQMRVSSSAGVRIRIPINFWQIVDVRSEGGENLGTMLATAQRRWNRGEYPTEPGQHTVPVFDRPITLADNGYAELIRFELQAILHVSQELYLGHVPIIDLRGFRDEQTGNVITNAFTTGVLDANQVTDHWQRVKAEEELPFKPVLRVRGLLCTSIDG